MTTQERQMLQGKKEAIRSAKHRGFPVILAVLLVLTLCVVRARTSQPDLGQNVPTPQVDHSSVLDDSKSVALVAHSVASLPPATTVVRPDLARIQAGRANKLRRLPPVGQSGTAPMTLATNQQRDPFGGEEVPPAPPNPSRFQIPIQGAPNTDDLQVVKHGGRISLTARDVPLQDVITLIARTQGLNLVVASPTDLRVTLKLDEVLLSDALNALLSPAGFIWNINGGVIFVTNLADGSQLPPEVHGRRVQVFELDYLSAADVDLAVKGLLSPIGQSFIMESSPNDNRRTKEVLVVEDIPAFVHRVAEYIMQIDVPPRQVLIEVHVLEIELEDDTRHGVNLEAVAQVANSNLSIQGFANPNAPQAFFLELTGGDLTGLVEALKTTTDAKTLASPRVMAVNGQESRIQIGEQLGFRVTTTTETSTLESVDFLDVGVVLRVIPRITRDGRVLMRIQPEVSSGEVNPETGLPEEETTEMETDVLLHNGQGIVIGGLIQERDSNLQSKVPILGDVYILGALFQRRHIEKKRSEIIVALLPQILPYDLHYHQRNREEFGRAQDALTYGPLCRYPRHYEARMPDVFYNPSYPLLRCWKHDPLCPSCPHPPIDHPHPSTGPIPPPTVPEHVPPHPITQQPAPQNNALPTREARMPMYYNR